jgi:hypothetical protein
MRLESAVSVAVGRGRDLVFERWRRRNRKHRANKQQGDVHALDREGDSRGGVPDPEYLHAEPEDLVEADGVATSGPAVRRREEPSPNERRARARDPS